MPGVIVDGFDFFAVHEAAGEAIARAREGGGPTLIEVKFTRYFGHFEGDQQIYRGRRGRATPGRTSTASSASGPGSPSGPAHRRPARPGRRARSPPLIDAAVDGGQGRAQAGRRRPAHRRLRLVLNGGTRHGTQHHLPRGDQRGAAPRRWSATSASSSWARTTPAARARPARRTPGAASSASPRACTASSPAGCWTRRSRSRRSSAPPSARRPAGCGPVAELMFIDFMGVCFDQIFNQAAKFRYMFGGKAVTPVVIRTMWGAGLRAAAQHSQSPAAGVHPHPRAQGGRRRRTRTTPRACSSSPSATTTR